MDTGGDAERGTGPGTGRGTGPASAGPAVRVTRSLSIPTGELRWRATTSGGPGGQHANRSSTRVEVSWEVASSAALGSRQRDRLLARIGPVVRATAGEHRSQSRNRELAMERLVARVAAALRVDPPRRATRPTKGAKERRLEAKRQRGQTKALRRRWSGSDD